MRQMPLSLFSRSQCAGCNSILAPQSLNNNGRDTELVTSHQSQPDKTQLFCKLCLRKVNVNVNQHPFQNSSKGKPKAWRVFRVFQRSVSQVDVAGSSGTLRSWEDSKVLAEKWPGCAWEHHFCILLGPTICLHVDFRFKCESILWQCICFILF